MVYHRNPKLEFYYMTHIDNLSSILKQGILSRELIEKIGYKPKQIADPNVVKKRKQKGLAKFANLYIHPRNAMLYKVSKFGWENKVVILGISSEVLNIKGTEISIGNAAADSSLRIPISKAKNIDKFFREFLTDLRGIRYWGDEKHIDISKYLNFLNDSRNFPSYYISEKQFLQSEILVPEKVHSSYIKAIYVPNEELEEEIKRNYPDIPSIISPDLFFLALREELIETNIKIIQGDMFISDCKLLTISVNTVGVMGKGLASRFKYMYPESYVVYQDMCKRKQLKPGQPQIYWSETYKRYFLFFPTKKHWKENSKLEMIKQGLEWCVKNLPKYENINSAAFPALGCGLGKLKWEDVGPLMIDKLSKLKNIQFEIYLPADKKLPEEYFQTSFYREKKNYDLTTEPTISRINLELF